MLIKVKVSVGQQNNERIIAKVIKQNKCRRIKKVSIENDIISIEFSEDNNWAVKNTVKQYSKEKYPPGTDIPRMNNFSISWAHWRPVALIELSESWIVFYERNFK